LSCPFGYYIHDRNEHTCERRLFDGPADFQIDIEKVCPQDAIGNERNSKECAEYIDKVNRAGSYAPSFS
jgi:hypothetical protein